MKTRHLALLLALAALCACGGGTDAPDAALVADPTDGDPVGDPVDDNAGVEAVAQENQVVVRYDHDGDGNPDHLTLDTTTTPYRIVEALGGTGAGVPVDLTAVLKDQPIDPAVSDAVEAHRASSLGVASETTLDVVNQSGEQVTVTIYE